MHNNNKEQHLQNLKGLVNNREQWEQFSNYLDYLISNQHRNLEQADTDIIVYRTQGAISALKRLRALRDEIYGNIR